MSAPDRSDDQSVRSAQWTSDGLGPSAPSLSVTVLFTTIPHTLKALRRAANLAHELGACIQILIPSVVPYPLPLDKPRIDPEFRFRQFRTRCEHEKVETWLDIRLCRDARQCICEAVRPHSLIVLGVRQTRWPRVDWPWFHLPWTYEKRLARELTRAGHQVVLVDDADL